MSLSPRKERALVTGGAGLIGSHIVDLLRAKGWSVRVLDNLEPQTHRDGKPPWLEAAIRNGAEFVEGDMRDREVVESALDGIDVEGVTPLDDNVNSVYEYLIGNEEVVR